MGASNEHLAAAYFLRRGVQVYWPATQQDCTDFLISHGKDFKRVQVKTASWSTDPNGRGYLQCRTRLTNKYQGVAPSDLYDIFFIVSGVRGWIIPAAKIDSSNLCLDALKPKNKTRKRKWGQFEVSLID